MSKGELGLREPNERVIEKRRLISRFCSQVRTLDSESEVSRRDGFSSPRLSFFPFLENALLSGLKS